jgi:F1F0 ATPase subunit 2
MLQLMLSLFAGAGVGALFFEGLWRTVSKAAATTTPVRRFVLSFAVRAAILLTVLWLVSRGDPFRLAACMLGFLVGRTVILRMHRGGKEVAD